MSTMRRLTTFIMIALLALQGLTNAAMAMQMLPQELNSSPSAKVLAVGEAHLPCHMAGSADADAANTDTQMSACTACQACHLSAIEALQAPPLASAAPTAQPASPVMQWASATLALTTKPPLA